MNIRTILVQLELDGAPQPRIEFARSLASRFEAGLVGFAAGSPHSPMLPPEAPIGALEIMQREIEEIEARLKQLKEAFQGSVGDGAEIAWLGLVGEPTRTLLEQAHCADLIVTGPTSVSDSARTVDTGALILSAGRPVLVTSQKADPLVAGRIVLAWKNTREARRAVADALPVLTLADDVLVVGVNEGETGGLREELAGVVRYLMKHGIKARSELLTSAGDELGFDISTTAFELGADLIVAGGYGHSRLREWAFGGVTRTLLGASSMHRFFSN